MKTLAAKSYHAPERQAILVLLYEKLGSVQINPHDFFLCVPFLVKVVITF